MIGGSGLQIIPELVLQKPEATLAPITSIDARSSALDSLRGRFSKEGRFLETAACCLAEPPSSIFWCRRRCEGILDGAAQIAVPPPSLIPRPGRAGVCPFCMSTVSQVASKPRPIQCRYFDSNRLSERNSPTKRTHCLAPQLQLPTLELEAVRSLNSARLSSCG
jgi:hypothetical protein